LVIVNMFTFCKHLYYFWSKSNTGRFVFNFSNKKAGKCLGKAIGIGKTVLE
jgi:hypothetical protein